MKASVRLGAIALALLAASAASASTTVLDGKGFDIVYDSGISAFAASTALPFSLSADGKGVVFNTSTLNTSDTDALSDLSFSIVADQGYTFSGLSLYATGSYALTRDKKNEAYAGLTSSISVTGSAVKPLSDSQEVSKSLTKGSKAASGTWDLSSNYDLSSGSFSTASQLNFSSTLLLSSFVNKSGLATIKATDYTLSVATAPVPEPGEWAMMLAGLGMLGTIIGRRSRS